LSGHIRLKVAQKTRHLARDGGRRRRILGHHVRRQVTAGYRTPARREARRADLHRGEQRRQSPGALIFEGPLRATASPATILCLSLNEMDLQRGKQTTTQSEHITNSLAREFGRTQARQIHKAITNQVNLVCKGPSTTSHLTPSQREERSIAWRTLTDAEIAALIGTRVDVERTGVGIVVGVIDDDGRREVVA
jgi:hypothetical protein